VAVLIGGRINCPALGVHLPLSTVVIRPSVQVTVTANFFDVLEKRDNLKENLPVISGTGNSKNCEHLVRSLQ
jgi:hypothetical protein